jgi:Tfp pilus assembly protein PilF
MDRIEKLKAFISQKPMDHFSKHALAMEYIKLGDDQAAKGLLNSILLADPGYTGSYYHLGKLLEREGDKEGAVSIYEKGMAEAKKQGDNHAWSELMSAREAMD